VLFSQRPVCPPAPYLAEPRTGLVGEHRLRQQPGYSSLAYLQRLPVDELKIDRSFVTRLADVSDDAIIVRSTIDLAHNLGLKVVADSPVLIGFFGST
jgi:hypothetical protein